TPLATTFADHSSLSPAPRRRLEIGFVFPARLRLGQTSVRTHQRLTPLTRRANWPCSVTFPLLRDLPALHSLATDHWPLATVPSPHASPAGSGRVQALPRWLLPSTDSRIGKD